MHLLSTILALSLDPKEILNDLSPYGEIGLILIIFAETGLLVGFFLPGDSLLFTAGLLCTTTSNNRLHLALPAVLIAAIGGALIGAQVGYQLGRSTGPALNRRTQATRLWAAVSRGREVLERYGPVHTSPALIPTFSRSSRSS